MTAILVVRDLVVRRGGRRIVDGRSFEVGAREVVAAVGANGSGKSTLLGCVGGVLAPAAGAVLVDGASVWGAERRVARRALGYLPEAADPPGHLTGAELWALVAAVKESVPPDAALTSALRLDEIVGVRIDRMSLGQRRRACLAAALIGEPPLLILDEPDNGLDDLAHVALVDLLASHRDRGGAALISTHDPALIERLGARTIDLAVSSA